MKHQPRYSVAVIAKVHDAALSAETVASMGRMYALGMTAREIAEATGLALNRVHKAIGRNRDVFPRRQERVVHIALPEPESDVIDFPTEAEPRTRTEYEPGIEQAYSGPTPAAQGSAVTLMQLTGRTCRWPLSQGKGATSLFCGRETFLKHSYCPDCRKRSAAPKCEVVR